MLKTGTRFSLRDKQLFELSEVEITRVDSSLQPYANGHNLVQTCCKHIPYLAPSFGTDRPEQTVELE